jgi:hypothetical protein
MCLLWAECGQMVEGTKEQGMEKQPAQVAAHWARRWAWSPCGQLSECGGHLNTGGFSLQYPPCDIIMALTCSKFSGSLISVHPLEV